MSGSTRAPWMQPVAETFVLWFVVTLTAFYLGLAGNETDTMAYARHAADPTWLPNDWFLTRQIPYRGLFNALLGHLLEIVGTTPGIVVGRLLSFALFAFACQRLIAAAHVPLALGVAIVYWNINRITGIAAGEWMVRGLETKAFAWPFVLLAVAALLRQRWRSYWLSLGAALSFHVLVGAYAFLGLAAATLAVHRRAALGALRDSWGVFRHWGARPCCRCGPRPSAVRIRDERERLVAVCGVPQSAPRHSQLATLCLDGTHWTRPCERLLVPDVAARSGADARCRGAGLGGMHRHRAGPVSDRPDRAAALLLVPHGRCWITPPDATRRLRPRVQPAANTTADSAPTGSRRVGRRTDSRRGARTGAASSTSRS